MTLFGHHDILTSSPIGVIHVRDFHGTIIGPDDRLSG